MNEKLKNPDYRRMYQVLRERLTGTIVRAIVTVLVFNIMLSFLLTSGLTPFMIFRNSVVGILLSVAFTSIILTAAFMAFYGIITDFTNIILGKRSYSNVMFLGFLDKSRRVFRSSVFFTVIVIFAAAVTAIIVFLLRERILSGVNPFFDYTAAASGENLSAEDSESVLKFSQVLLLSVFYTVFFFFIFILSVLPFVFIWSAFIEDRRLDFKGALKKSLFIMRGRYFHYIGFVIFSCIKNIVIMIVICAVNFVIPKEAAFVSFLLGFYAFIQYYTILVKVFCCIPVYYFSFLSVNGMIGNTAGNETKEITE